MKTKLTTVAAALLLCVTAIPASQATVIKFSFSGVVTRTGSGVISDQISVGDPVTGMASYDTLDFEQSSPANREFRSWSNNSTMSLTIKGMTWSFDSGFAQVRDFTSPDIFPDSLNIGSHGISGPETFFSSSLGMYFLGPNSVLSNAVLPNKSELLSLFGPGGEVPSYDINGDAGNLGIIANDSIGFSITSAALLPEPGTLALFGLGLASIGFAARHGRDGRFRRNDPAE